MKNKLHYLGYTFIIFIFGIINTNAQICDAGPDRTLECINNGVTVNLDDLLADAGKNDTNSNSSKVFSWRWVLKSAPLSPRGPRRIPPVENGDKVDFPNTGAGPEEYYVFEYTVSDDGCTDTSEITICVLGDEAASFNESSLYICEDETVTNKDELFNASPLNEIRDFFGYWEDADNNELTESSFPLGEGAYTYFDSSGNINDVLVYEIPCSNKDINLSFANAQNTNDGVNDYFEVDVMIQTINSTGSFKLRDGKLFFQYNVAAFGEYVNANDRIEVTQPDGYIAGQSSDSDPSKKNYYEFKTYDNTNNGSVNRVSWGFSGYFTLTSNNVNETPKKLCHLKIKYVDATKLPLFTYESNGIYDDQFREYSTIYPFNNGSISNDSFDSNGATLSDNDFEILTNISLFPNPTKNTLYTKGDISKIKTIHIYSITGKHVMTIKNSFEEINISRLETSIYFVKLNTENTSKTFKIIKK